MSIFAQEKRLIGAAGGYQEPIRGTNVSVSGTPTRADVEGNQSSGVGAHNKLAGAGSLGPGTYYYYLNCGGAAAIDVTLRASTVTGTHTITLYPVLSDGVTIKGTATSVSSLVANTQATTSLTTLRGERGVMLKIVVNGASALVFDQAEHSAL